MRSYIDDWRSWEVSLADVIGHGCVLGDGDLEVEKGRWGRHLRECVTRICYTGCGNGSDVTVVQS